MIVKSMARKTRSFGQLLRYLNTPTQTGPALLHNLRCRSDDLAQIEAELLNNSRLLSERKNGNYLYHEVLSFGVGDRENVTPTLLEDLTRRYLELRAPRALAYAKAHLETANAHVHLLISANNVGSSRRLRLSRRNFDRVKHQLEAVQRQQYPQLEHSLVCGPDRNRRRARSRREGERERRQHHAERNQLSKKERLEQLIRSTLSIATSGIDCFRRLQAHGFELYRRGKSVGVRSLEGGRRYRLRTLGLAEEFDQALERWRRLADRVRAVQKAEERGRDRDRQQGRGRSP